MATIQNPKYDNDYVTLGYLKKTINEENNETNKKIENIPKNYNSPPVPPYYVGSLLLINGTIYRCIKSRLVGSFNMSDWQIIVSTEEIDEALKFIYDVNKLEYVDQQDGMIETFYQKDDPSVDWITNLDKENHVSDLWTVDLVTHYQYEKKSTNPVTYGWKKINVPSSLFDVFDGYKRIFLIEPTNYEKDDLWFGETTKVAIESSENFDESHWEERDDFIQSSKIEQEEYHKIYLLPKITEINRQSLAEIKKAVDEITLTVSQTYTTKTEVEKYVDDVKVEVAETYTTKEEMNAQISIASDKINSIVEKNTTQDNEIGYLNQEYSVIKQQSDEVKVTIANQNNQIAEITQTVEELNSKISDIADITISGEDTDAQVELNNINQSEPIRLVIRPIGENISYLYPNSKLFPSSKLFLKTRTIRFANTKTNENFDYILPANLLYYDEENYDEFILDYDGQSCVVNKRVGYNADGTTYVLENPTTIEYEYPKIELTDGDYTVSILGYDNAYIFVRLMAQNIYTTQFATRAEMNSEISQTAGEINSQVRLKVGKNEVISSINQTAEKIKIEANKVNVSGIITAMNNDTTTTINGNKITTGTIKTEQISSNAITTDKIQVGAITTEKIQSGAITSEKIKANSITSDQVASDIITTKNFSAQNINADNITSGIISTDRLDSKVITTDNFSAQKINADNITSGTLSADKISGGTINASTISLKNVTLGTSSSKIGGWTINSSSFSSGDSTINANGEVYFYPQLTNGGILGLNTGFRCKGPSGIAIYNDTAYYGTNTIQSGITLLADSGNLTLGQKSQSYSVNIRSYCSPSVVSNAGARSILLAAGNDIYMDAVGGSVWANGNGLANSRVKTEAGSSSSKSVKENIVEFENTDYENALTLLDKMKLYSYDYKYNMYKNPHKYGFIIDELEQFDETKQFFDFEEYNATVKDKKLDFSGKTEGDTTVNVKTYDTDVLDKYLLTLCKAMYEKIKTLEEKLNVD